MEEQGLPRGDLHDDLPLPDDVLADLLRRLAPQSLAAARCVRKAWRRTIDERHLLRADKLPLSLAGIFIQFDYHVFPEFFARPSSSAHAAVNTKLDFLPRPSYPFGEVGDLVFQDYFVQDHCNGLLLTYGYVVNPATRCWDPFTPHPYPTDPMGVTNLSRDYLAFDPAVSPHYQVLSIPYLHEESTYKSMVARGSAQLDPLMEKSEWPPSTFILYVFSSRSGQWERRSFARQVMLQGL